MPVITLILRRLALPVTGCSWQFATRRDPSLSELLRSRVEPSPHIPVMQLTTLGSKCRQMWLASVLGARRVRSPHINAALITLWRESYLMTVRTSLRCNTCS